MARTKKKALYIDAESTYGTDPDSTGAGALWIPAMSISDVVDKTEVIETNYSNARPYPTAPIPGRDGWELSFEIPLIGLPTGAGNGVSPGTADWLDALLLHVFGVQTDAAGEGVVSSTSSTITLDTDLYDAHYLMPVHETDLPSATAARTQWAMVTVDPGDASYTIAPNWTANPTVGANAAYGTRSYRLDDNGGPSVTLTLVEDDVTYSLNGARCTSFSIAAEAGSPARASLSFAGDTKTSGAKASLPVPAAGPAVTPVVSLVSGVWYDGTAYATRSVNIDLGISAAEIMSTAAVNGRADYELVGTAPTITIEPLRTDAIDTLRRAVDKGPILVQLGRGDLSGGILNTLAVYCTEACVVSSDRVDDNGVLRQSMQFQITNADAVSEASASKRFFQLARA